MREKSEVRVKLVLEGGRRGEIVLRGSNRAVRGLVRELRRLGGPLEVAGGNCCWALSRGGTVVHVLVDSDKVA